MQCPQAVLDYISEWEDLEPLHAPASLTSDDGFTLNNIWAVWIDEEGSMHAVEYTEGVLKEYVFTKAYVMKDTTPDYEDGNISVRSLPLH